MKYLQRIFSVLLIASMLVGFLATGSILAGSPRSVNQQTDPASKFEPLVLDQLRSGNADFFVLMSAQADLSGAADLQTKQAKGEYVFKTVVDTANRTQADLKAYLDQQGVEYTSYYVANTILVKAGSLALANEIAARTDVAQILANKTYKLDDPPADPKASNTPVGIESNISFVNAPQVWALGITGQGTVLAGNDTGLDWDHPALIRQYRGCLNPPECTEIDHNYNWWDATGTSPLVPIDNNDHGTHTSGTMVGDDGGANQIGMAPGARLVHCKNMDAGGGGVEDWFLTCFQWDLAPWDLNHNNPNPDLAPDAVNNSWGFWGGNNPIFRDAIDALQAAGTAVEVSAGNEGPGCSTLRSPGDYQEVLTTGSIDHIGHEFPGIITVSYWSTSRGPSDLDGNYFPDIMAPGNGIRSSVDGGGYEGGWGGTSMAGPHATALVALIWSANPALHGQVAETMNIIRETAGPLTGQTGSNCGGDYEFGPNNDWGSGTIDALAAVQAAISMGGAGQLDGTVTDLETGDPIEGVNVLASHEAGFKWSDTTDPTGYYTMTVAEGTYTVTVSKYGYLTQDALGIEVVSGTLTTQDFAMVAAPTHTVSGHVYDAVSGAPLQATVGFTDAPVDPVTTGPDGFYSLTVAEGLWHIKAQADSHTPKTELVDVHSDVTLNILLDPLPCILLVDDDGDGPDQRAAYTSALDDLGYGYNVWDLGGGQGNPTADDLLGYRHVIWYTGFPFGDTFNAANEAAVKSYLDEGGNFFLSSQDYLFDFGITPFGSDYLHIASFSSDVNQTQVTGANVFAGLGPYTLVYPFTNYSDVVNPDAQAQLAFSGNQGNAAISFDGANFKTIFFGYPFEALPDLQARSDVMKAAVTHFGGCEPPINILLSTADPDKEGSPGTEVTYTYTVTNDSNFDQDVSLSVESIWPTEAPTSTGVILAHESTTIPVVVSIPMVVGQDIFVLTAQGSVGGFAQATGTTKSVVTPGVKLVAPAGQTGKPLDVLTYEFEVTNTGSFTDSFTISASGVWSFTLPITDTGPLAPEASKAFNVLVTVPEGAGEGDTDVTSVTATSTIDPLVADTKEVTSTAKLIFNSFLPITFR